VWVEGMQRDDQEAIYHEAESPRYRLSTTALYPHLAKEETVVDMNFISLG